METSMTAATDVARSVALVRRGLEACFPAVLDGYEYLSVDPKGANPHIERVDVAAFLDEQQRDLTTVAVAAKVYPAPLSENPFRNGVRSLSPGLYLAMTPYKVQWWVGQLDEPLDETDVADIEADFTRHRVVPEEMRRAKQGLQASLFAQLPEALDYARVATSRAVTQRFALAVGRVRERNGLNKLTALGLDVLAAIILDDKRFDIRTNAEQERALDPREALRRARAHFPLSFSDVPEVADDILHTFWVSLRDDMVYRSMGPDDLSDLLSALYEGVLLDPELRRQQGSYYTPHAQARKVLEHLPIERIPPEARVVFDGSCGSGNLLRAAIERMETLFPRRTTRRERAKYLGDHLIGLDIDPFAVNVARKVLLLTNYDDRQWNVRVGDFHDATNHPPKRPTIIIANPPFGSNTDDQAARFLAAYLDLLAPGGLMGIFLPAALLQNPGATAVRRRIVDTCDVLEMWRLPERAIPGSHKAIVVLMLRHRTASRHATRVYVVDKREDVADFAVAGKSASQSFVVDQDRWRHDPQARLRTGVLEDVWASLTGRCLSLRALYGKTHNGVKARKDQQSSEAHPDYRRALIGSTGLDPYCIRWDFQRADKFVLYPDDHDRLRRELEGPRTPTDFEVGVKLVIQGMRNAGSPWRLVAAIDDTRLVVKESFIYVLPGEHSLPVLAAILNSSVANAWYSEHDVERNIQQTILNELPVPIVPDEVAAEIEQLVARIAARKRMLWGSVTANDDAWREVRDWGMRLDDLVYAAYGLLDTPEGQRDRARIEATMGRGKRPGIEWRTQELAPPERVLLEASNPASLYPTAGTVLAVDLASRTMTADIPGVARSLLTFPIPPAVPGWALEEGVDFTADIPEPEVDAVMQQEARHRATGPLPVEPINLYNVSLPKRAYMAPEELLRALRDGHDR